MQGGPRRVPSAWVDMQWAPAASVGGVSGRSPIRSTAEQMRCRPHTVYTVDYVWPDAVHASQRARTALDSTPLRLRLRLGLAQTCA